ncbi:hypothetical protein [Larsenimonas rhizosphaerae]|uniref:Uracil-DNA glycosylase-like domain-containing protein n=1 Tax=Larsenimonas rhizosphaerae TaxID=2944682 RepID=A0AA42CYQ9_9GAMM|nr:hypothetical protein [Larsenimonas rhizosphaerae]MCX2525488.1 hypothetical protein [Larsenimonas rhizosphaerae]
MSDELITLYRKILLETDFSPLEEEKANYSGVFLPVPGPAFGQSGFKLMVVGQETRGWNGSLEKLLSAQLNNTLDEYLGGTAENYLAQLNVPINSVFLRFLKTTEKRLNMAPMEIFWANLLACSYRKKSPRGRPKKEYEALRKLSSELLSAQIKLINPDAILFLTGPGHDKTIKAMGMEHFNGHKRSWVKEKRRLWFFELGSIPCCRTTHPCHFAGKASRIEAVDAIANFKQNPAIPMYTPSETLLVG